MIQSHIANQAYWQNVQTFSCFQWKKSNKSNWKSSTQQK